MKSHGNRGYSLIEVVISILIFGVISILLVNILLRGGSFYESVVNRKEIKDNIYLAERRLKDDLLGVRDVQHILYADKVKFRFKNSSLDTIQYRYQNGTLYRSKNSEGEYPVAQYLSDSTRFYYITVTDSVIIQDPLNASSLLTIWLIRLDMHAEKGTQSMEVRTSTFPPNLWYGIVKD